MSDFYVASRGVSPVLNASAISGEYLSAASFLGVAGLILARGVDMLWLPVGLDGRLPAAARLRRGAAAALGRLHAARLRPAARSSRSHARRVVEPARRRHRACSTSSRSSRARASRCAPSPVRRSGWARSPSPSSSCLNVLPGGMRSVTLVQAFHYWLKLRRAADADLLPPRRLGDRPAPQTSATVASTRSTGSSRSRVTTRSTSPTPSSLATFFGTMGLPHVVVRFYTNPDGRAARRTTLVVLGLLAALLPAARCLRRPRPDARLRPRRRRAGRLRRARAAGRLFDGALGRGAHRPPRGGRLRRVPLDLDGPRRLGRRRPQPGPRCAGAPSSADGACAPSAWRRSSPWASRLPSPSCPQACRWRTPSSSPSPSPPRRSARCCCSGSGGVG